MQATYKITQATNTLQLPQLKLESLIHLYLVRITWHTKMKDKDEFGLIFLWFNYCI